MDERVALEIRGLEKRFGEFRVLRGVDLSILNGSAHAIIGPNGAGKTTLINVVSGLLPASRGSVRLGDVEITNLRTFQVARKGLIRTFQITSLFDELTVRDNIEVGLVARENYRDIEATGPEVAATANAVMELIGLEAIAEEKVDCLSHGDQRLVELAVALAVKPRLLLLDEPTAGMSPFETGRFIRLVNNRLRSRYTIVLVEHDMDVVMQTADRISVLESGRVIANGSPDEIVDNVAVQEAYLGRT